ncbi:Shwachman-Bodian-diamond syndrome protein-domain-containing protein [Mycena rosella]|uniref:Shwachman-Bodian-diamond syndrome protein-domain-containing protein n=1 Tax=Mycena rosella TaxID=1033263 RepID=A0AAD7AXK4_MYCRO|nr:Shwachman-Bodian-diamond syndrome protein-domain-containing protein [Mycena rosella]
MSKINQPSNQIKLTNVSIIASYKNKVQEWRTGVETNLDDVLQISNVFTNVSKGEVSKTNDLQKAFGKTEIAEIVKEILKKGEVQVGEKERDHDLMALRKEIATLVTEKCEDPTMQRPYAVGMIEKAMAEAGFSMLPIQRSRMRVWITMPTADGKQLREVVEGAEKMEDDEMGQDKWEVIMLIDPGQFRVLNDLLRTNELH